MHIVWTPLTFTVLTKQYKRKKRRNHTNLEWHEGESMRGNFIHSLWICSILKIICGWNSTGFLSDMKILDLKYIFPNSLSPQSQDKCVKLLVCVEFPPLALNLWAEEKSVCQGARDTDNVSLELWDISEFFHLQNISGGWIIWQGRGLPPITAQRNAFPLWFRLEKTDDVWACMHKL